MNLSEDHWTDAHPGPITNTDFMEDDKQNRNLYGTDTDESLRKEYVDQYIDTNSHQQYDFMIFNTELWEFLFKRYGGTPVKRFYVKSGSYFTNVESKLMSLRVMYLNSEKLLKGDLCATMFRTWWTQVSRHTSSQDIKKRMIDHVNAAGSEITVDEARMWLYANDSADPENKLEFRCRQIKESYDQL